MPSLVDLHWRKAERNKGLAHSYLTPNPTRQLPLDWAIVAAFYAAVHYVNAYLSTVGTVPRTHEQREQAMAKDAVLRRVLPQYLQLKDMSEQVRYVPTFQAARADLDTLLRIELPQIEACIRQALGRP